MFGGQNQRIAEKKKKRNKKKSILGNTEPESALEDEANGTGRKKRFFRL